MENRLSETGARSRAAKVQVFLAWPEESERLGAKLAALAISRRCRVVGACHDPEIAEITANRNTAAKAQIAMAVPCSANSVTTKPTDHSPHPLHDRVIVLFGDARREVVLTEMTHKSVALDVFSALWTPSQFTTPGEFAAVDRLNGDDDKSDERT